MSARFEWAHASDGPELVSPDELDELAPDGNDDRDYGLAWMTGSDGAMVYGSLDDLSEMVTRMQTMILAARQTATARLEYLRGEIRAERISQGEVIELQGLASFIDPGDVELLEWAGVPEHGTTPVWLTEGDGIIVINDEDDMRGNFEDDRGLIPDWLTFEAYCAHYVHADMPAHLTGDAAQEWAAQQL